MNLKQFNPVSKPPRDYNNRFKIEEGDRFVAVKGADILASERLRDKPMSACFKAPQSLAPSPTMDTI